MKKLLFIVLSVISINCFSQDTAKISILPDSTKITFGKVYSDVKAGLSGLSSALKVGAGHVYEILVRQQIVNSITNILLYILGVFIIVYFAKNFQKAYKRTQDKQDDWYKDELEDHFSLIGNLIISLMLFLIVGISICASITDTITGFINPEYGAIKEIINFVK
jgi:putative Mn2+ efflux pump MntP